MLDPNQLKTFIIVPTLQLASEVSARPLYSKAAVSLLLGTCAHESKLGMYIDQVTKNETLDRLIPGPALGIYQMEIATYKDCWDRGIKRLNLVTFVKDRYAADRETPERMVEDLAFATLMARLKYFLCPGSIPTDTEGQANYWKKFYNTELGAGKVTEYLYSWGRYNLDRYV